MTKISCGCTKLQLSVSGCHGPKPIIRHHWSWLRATCVSPFKQASDERPPGRSNRMTPEVSRYSLQTVNYLSKICSLIFFAFRRHFATQLPTWSVSCNLCHPMLQMYLEVFYAICDHMLQTCIPGLHFLQGFCCWAALTSKLPKHGRTAWVKWPNLMVLDE